MLQLFLEYTNYRGKVFVGRARVELEYANYYTFETVSICDYHFRLVNAHGNVSDQCVQNGFLYLEGETTAHGFQKSEHFAHVLRRQCFIAFIFLEHLREPIANIIDHSERESFNGFFGMIKTKLFAILTTFKKQFFHLSLEKFDDGRVSV